MDRFFFRFSTFSEKMKHDFFFACSIEFRSFELLVYLCGSIKCLLKDYYKLCESIGKIITGVINATDSLTGNITRPDSLSPLIYLWYCNLKPWRPCWFTRANFFLVISKSLGLNAGSPDVVDFEDGKLHLVSRLVHIFPETTFFE